MTHPGLNAFNDRLDLVPSSGIRLFFDLVLTMDDVISLGVGEPDFTTPWGICNSAILSIEQGETHYTSNQGILPLRSAISTLIHEYSGVRYCPENEMIVTVGASEAIDIALRAVINPGDSVVIPEPTYISYSPLATLAGATVIPVNTGETQFVPTLAAIQAAVTDTTKLIMLCSPSNPTGAVIPPETLAAIGQFAYERGIWVLVDEIYYDLVYDGPVQSFLSTYPNAKTNTIYVGGVSKNYAMTGWRIGYLCGPKAFIERALKIHQYTVMCVPTVGQYAALEAIRNHAGSVASMRADYDQRRRLFVAGLNDLGLPTAMPEGALYCFVDIRSTGLSSEAFAVQLLETQRVAVVPGAVFGQGGEGYVRCCYAVAMADLKTALTRIEAFLNSR